MLVVDGSYIHKAFVAKKHSPYGEDYGNGDGKAKHDTPYIGDFPASGDVEARLEKE